MTALNEDLLQRVVMQVLEECAFLCTEPSAGSRSWSGPVTRVTLEFSGPRAGRVELHAGQALALAVAADMLGVDADDADAERLADGALAEVTNVITGSLVASLFGTDCLVELGIPVVDHRLPEPLSESDCGLTLVDMDGRAIDVRARFAEAS
jgi:CheY-specific phosphatase CheX